jgi:phenylacetate-CoA ligase
MMDNEYFNQRIVTMERAELEKMQLERLRWQLERCYRGSEFYRERFQEAGVRPEDIRFLGDVVHLPCVTKEELREEQMAHPPFGRYVVSPPEDWAELHPSTGTTGIPVNTIWSHQDVANITSWTARTLWNLGVRPGDIVQNGFSYGLWVAGMSVHYACREVGCFVIPIGAGLTERQIDYLANPGSTVLVGTPSFALHIAERMRERGIEPRSIPLRLGCFGGEAGTEVPSTRKKIEEGLGIDARDYYGLAEIGPTIASECREKRGLHWCEDHLLMEVVNPETRKPCVDGDVGVLVITHLTKEAMPMIRYWTNDYARLSRDRCECGRTHARSEGGILGRADDMVIYRGAKFYPAQVEKVVREVETLGDEFRIELSTDDESGTDKCTVVAEVRNQGADRVVLREQLKRSLKEELLVTPSVRFEPYGTLERTTFKAKRIEDRRKRD